jgi:hypothetical protein
MRRIVRFWTGLCVWSGPVRLYDLIDLLEQLFPALSGPCYAMPLAAQAFAQLVQWKAAGVAQTVVALCRRGRVDRGHYQHDLVALILGQVLVQVGAVDAPAKAVL